MIEVVKTSYYRPLHYEQSATKVRYEWSDENIHLSLTFNIIL